MSVSPRNILWPTDFSELSLLGGRYARELSAHFGATLHVVHVIPPVLGPDFSVVLPAASPAVPPESELIAACRARLEELVAEHFGAATAAVYDAFCGNPWYGVCEYARRNEIDLIVVATHGHTGLKHVVIGSTAERIVQHAPCPVLAVKHSQRDFVR